MYLNLWQQSDDQIFYCTALEKSISIEQWFQVTQHLLTYKHKENKNRKLNSNIFFIAFSSKHILNFLNTYFCCINSYFSYINSKYI